jgi:hypothetical protein
MISVLEIEAARPVRLIGMGCALGLTVWLRFGEENGKCYHQRNEKTDERNSSDCAELCRSFGLRRL